MKENEVLSYADLARLEQEEKQELIKTKKLLEEANAILSEIEQWWKDSSQANAVLTSRLQESENDLTKLLEEERRQKLIWKNAYESVIGSRSWKMISKMKRILHR